MEVLEPNLAILDGVTIHWCADTHLRIGEDWRREIIARLRECHCWLMLLSPAFFASAFIREFEPTQFVGPGADKGAVHELGRLVREAQELELSLGFDVERQLGSGLVPEIVLDSYRSSFNAVIGVHQFSESVSSVLARVHSFLETGYGRLASERDADGMRREVRRGWIAALVSTLAIPTSLLLSYFGMAAAEVDPGISVLDDRYWPIWVVYVAIVTFGLGVVARLASGKGSIMIQSGVKLSAHRGGPEGTRPPNSLATIAAAVDLGVDLVEFDVRVTRDGGFVTTHDAVVMVSGSPVAIEDLTEQEVLAAGIEAARLKEVLATIRGRACAHVDLKDTRSEVEIADLCESILGSGNYILTTLEDVSVRRLRDARPDASVALSLGRDISNMSRVKAARVRLSELFPARRVRSSGANMLAVNHRLARLTVLRWAARRGLRVLVWTCNDDDVIKWAWGDSRVWAFTTDFPRRALQLRSQ